ncbi:siderophore-interacting protein [Kribbella solani]|uniref:siderophore-interacting protein n=1 Tax=Kribbella solani TaxID=236067 RepID=UPI0029A5423F|nr:siderophore-interacting protein [Kribbella solani]MDX2970998.1 siderophore-interacting protein [Kribbella solani]
MGTTIRGEIRRLTRSGDSRVICPVRVEAVEPLTAHFSRVTVQGDGLAAYRTIRPADAFKLVIPPTGTGSVRMPKIAPTGAPVWPQGRPAPLMRAFTVRAFDPSTRRLSFDVAHHGTGPAITWLNHTRPGDTLVLFGIRREFHAGDVDHHLLIGDSTSLPAIASIVDTLDVRSTVILQAESPAEQALVKGDVHWVHAPPVTGPGSVLEQAVRAYRRPPGRLQAWCAAEAGVVRAIRPYLAGELGVGRDDLHTVAYWIAGATAERGDAERMKWYTQATEQGLDATDPAVLQALEFS